MDYYVAMTLDKLTAIVLVVSPIQQLRTFGDRAFYIAAPMLWNNLPTKIRLAKTLMTFTSLLKAHLFQQLYPEVV